jgi:hypothetical protein
MYNHIGEPLSKNDYLFCPSPLKIGKVISADSTAGKFETPKSLFYQFFKFEHFTTYVGKYGVAICRWTKRNKKEEIILYSDKNFINKLYKYKKLKDFYNKALLEYKNCKIKHLKKDILDNKDVVLRLKGGELILSKNRFILKTKNQTLIDLLKIDIVVDEIYKDKKYMFIFEDKYLYLHKSQIIDLEEFEQIIPFFMKVYNFSNKAKIHQAIINELKEITETKDFNNFLKEEKKYEQNLKYIPLFMTLFAGFVYLISLFFNQNFYHIGILVSIITLIFVSISDYKFDDYRKKLLRTAIYIDFFIFVLMGVL